MLAAALVASTAAAYPTVHVSPSASAVELFAAAELRNYLGNLSTRAGMPPVRLHVADEKPAARWESFTFAAPAYGGWTSGLC